MPDEPVFEVDPAPERRGWKPVVATAVALLLVVGGLGAFVAVSLRDDAPSEAVFASGDVEPLIDPDEIISGGPPPDGIPPIDEPTFEPVAAVDWIEPQEPVVKVAINDDVRAYPLQILTWHEIVNDEVGGVPISVTFCPLCNTAYAYERPIVDGEVTTFGTSGKLYLSNLVMYDRATDSYWPQAMGQAAVGPLTGTTLVRVPAQIVAWEDFRSTFRSGQVLSRDTGFERAYGENPYPGYDSIDNPPFLFTGEVDGRLAAVERVLGVEVGDQVAAFPYFELTDAATGGVAAVETELGGKPVLVLWKKGATSALDAQSIAASRDVGAAAAFSPKVDGDVLKFEVANGTFRDVATGSEWNIFGEAVSGPFDGTSLEPLDAHDSFWFDWAAFHPDTQVWSTG